jgi:hypothetical protein
MNLSEKTYDAAVTSCVFIAIASALLFDKVPQFRWLFAVAALCAGVAAVAFYFLFHSFSENKPELAEVVTQVEKVLEKAKQVPAENEHKSMAASLVPGQVIFEYKDPNLSDELVRQIGRIRWASSEVDFKMRAACLKRLYDYNEELARYTRTTALAVQELEAKQQLWSQVVRFSPNPEFPRYTKGKRRQEAQLVWISAASDLVH